MRGGLTMNMTKQYHRDLTQDHLKEVRQGKRFEFGDNWCKFLDHLDEARIVAAEASLLSMLEVPDLTGKSFLDVGSGSGLFSLAARRLGATVHSFDYDPQSVACTKELRRRYSENDPQWCIEQQSVLDTEYISSLGVFDVVYSWGVLHHTGAMWQALEHVQHLVTKGGLLFIAIYNDAGSKSARWRRVKQLYNALPRPLRSPYIVAFAGQLEMKAAVSSLACGRPGSYLERWSKNGMRGMSHWRDLVDWVGGYPYEVAKPEEVFDFYKARGFVLRRLKSTGGLGCNEFVFQKHA